MKFDVDTLYNNPKAQAVVFFPSNGTVDFGGNRVHPPLVRGLVENDLQMDVASLFSSVDPGQTGFIQNIADAATNLAGGARKVIKNVQQTLQQWDGHSSPIFSIPITVVKYKPSIDILNIIRTLTSAPAGNYKGIYLEAPYGYGVAGIVERIPSYFSDIGHSAAAAAENTPVIGTIARNLGLVNDETAAKNQSSELYRNFSSLVTGTWSLRYADFFYADCLILTHATAIVSKESVKGTNEPLYARITLTFTTAFLPDARTISSWFLPAFKDSGSYKEEFRQRTEGNSSAPLS